MMQGATEVQIRDGELRAGWPAEIPVSMWLVDEGEHWAGLASEFTIASMGASKEEARAELLDGLRSYMTSYAEEGATLVDTYRRIPRRWSLQLASKELLSRLTPGPPTVERSRDVLRPAVDRLSSGRRSSPGRPGSARARG
jgi:hypothetical protein